MKKLLIIALMMSLTAGCGQAEGFKGSSDVVKVSGPAVTAAAGQRVDFKIQLKIEKTWHLYAHGDSNFIGVDLVPDEGFVLEDLKLEFPKGHEGEFFGEKVMMIAGNDPITA